MDNFQSIVSVIIPLHNRFNLVDETVYSVYNQTYRPIELIIIDDCSYEPYIPKISSEPGFKVILLRHEKNIGPGATREIGRQVATGDYIAYLDSDDLMHPEKLQKQVAVLQERPGDGMCYSQSLEFMKSPFSGKENLRYLCDRQYKKFLPIVLYTRPWGTCACLWTKNAVKKIGPWSHGWHFEDIEYDIRAGIQDISICYVNEVLSFIRTSRGENRLSNKRTNYVINEKLNAYKRITRNLLSCGKLDDDEIRYFLERRLFKVAFEAFGIADKVSTIELFVCLSKVAKPLYKKFALYFYTLLYRLLPLKISIRLKYYLRKVVFKEYQNSAFQL